MVNLHLSTRSTLIATDSKLPEKHPGLLQSDAEKNLVIESGKQRLFHRSNDFVVHDKQLLFDVMACNIAEKGYSVQTHALPDILGDSLWAQSHRDEGAALRPAGVGRQVDLQIDQSIRSDKISWIDDTTATGFEWIKWAAELQLLLNSSLFLGLFSFESHYALYNPGGFYKTHVDAFRGERNRILSVIIYLNHGWQQSDAGELVLFTEGDARIPLTIKPEYGTIVAFLSEEIPHQVLVTNRNRYSIAGWFRSRHLGVGPT